MTTEDNDRVEWLIQEWLKDKWLDNPDLVLGIMDIVLLLRALHEAREHIKEINDQFARASQMLNETRQREARLREERIRTGE